MTRKLESLSAFESKSINQLEMKNVLGGYMQEVSTLGGSRQWGGSGSGYWSGNYSSDCTGDNGVTSYEMDHSSVKWNACQ